MNAHDTAVRTLTGNDPFSVRRIAGRTGIYILLALWALICLFPLYWTASTSIKSREAVIQGPKYVPFVDFQPDDKGWFPLLYEAGQRANFLRHFQNTLVVSLLAALLAVVLGSLAAYGLSRYQYRYGPYDNTQIRNFFLAQLILPPAAVALPILLMFINLGLKDTREGLILIYTVMNLPIVIWIMYDQFNSIPSELEQAAQVDGASIWGHFFASYCHCRAWAGRGLYLDRGPLLERIFHCLGARLDRRGHPAIPHRWSGQLAGHQVVDHGSPHLCGYRAAGDHRHSLERYIVKGLTAGSVK